ncbi:MAG: PEP-CTERM sorting domain-containing protein [Microcystis aeruginosa Ma_MB_S_20031200_S102]|uniref:PEP-CTERM sorting domain-containing protein n=1 Tax=Microcystis aeruginosa Ma_MB_S_20031200_S102 TaxID=2486254 RepID=A0A552F0M5_MICAE|nr:MAG: PEP-CTERM sorting domain-containing protein [Microcystis aeruginosa Ma_MB_S_20031200_S102D]TRU40271.1 MAG: PEP-CTERM sorting domain-containing protein [Microcystis aeruginosa Ma_MB_S_20031200_S102]
MSLKKYFNKPLTVALATVATATLAQSASAATFNFSFGNVEGPVSGTVQGTLTLPDGDGTNLAATSVIVTSAPAALGYTLPFNVPMNSLFGNSFTVSGGVITASSFLALGAFGGFSLNFSTNGSLFTIASSFLPFSGVVDRNSTTLTYSPAAPTTVPEPATVLGLLSVAGVGLLCKGRKLEG